ncbi:MAG: 3-deoxy-manno-octulosonate cytidylyltransferase [Gemmatimonadetes bacterium]|uniref:3-deoxy-manno-octulosonate cytidylyltransferase n=1 Tax=Candidatus Kutchimonas denitrificans TaxID=3056748 RepID=A0AAE4Z9P0_9BACT|nr:3-deoxy-manno-octulosonate cytidylyltransferase [Gemmatimonadota bacterium]NIR75237.1 3-deoxy-manno-octulosonate cytidylyltransferase [Candidatus Kutchimonas denitrificans]NIS00175.1 3-deoxy-manno-octulosonate cytidylyltransferase [Gemmatimonadota bacterium]NIT65767.1 3-deoxy-manno-octulosonate cytidylyltransferase [Gemmatimonadota bacterium]NIU53045.1 3-deoxy-manno-octulosonate cytidylyltransferase [Gemmatimonadota bacterium]
MRVLGVIPARLGSVRLPRKPLLPIAGRPLIEWVWRRMHELVVLDQLVVATDAEEVVEAVEGFGGRAVMTRTDHASGTDRIAEVAGREEFAGYDRVVNLQGDEPFLPAAAAAGAVDQLEVGWDVGTAAVPFASRDEWQAPSTVKVVRGDDGGALYFSRAPIPYDRDGEGLTGGGAPLKHVGIYAFDRGALLEATALPEHPLERRERLEQLRWLAAGLRIGVALVEGGGPGIDTEDDLARAEAILGGRLELT